jgi:two-component system, chemotaxis family, CheB/CheR fusion protein
LARRENHGAMSEILSRELKAKRAQSNSNPAAASKSSIASNARLVVGIGASAGGLEACKKLIAALPANGGVAAILVQHLDPTHESLMVALLAVDARIPVLQAVDGMPIKRDHLYVIPPGVYLSVKNGALRLSPPQARHGARLPFDFLLRSLAQSYGARAAAVILSGTGADGSEGLKSIKQSGGLVIAQDPREAEYDGMPRSAIATGQVDLVLPAVEIAHTLIAHRPKPVNAGGAGDAGPTGAIQRELPAIVALLRAKTAHDFTHYKPGTLERRIERRMALKSIIDANVYLQSLIGDADERDLLAKDLLINVTGFFRDPAVFDLLARTTIPDLIRNHAGGQPLRIWIAGCSSGEETYSLAMLFREQIAESGRDIKLQVFASDVDPDAVASARDGVYPQTIEAAISSARLAQFFTKERAGYRISPELRAHIVFTVQDLLADPPFSRIDFISCRNLLIYLKPEAQAKVVALFHFALREGGLLLLGGSETIGVNDRRFAVVAESQRLYSRTGRNRASAFGVAAAAGPPASTPARVGAIGAPSRPAALAALCQRKVLETYAPATVLINQKQECLFFQGPVDRFLSIASGHAELDLLALARHDIRAPLRVAIQRAHRENRRVEAQGGRVSRDPSANAFTIVIEPISNDGEVLWLVCFVEAAKVAVGAAPRVGQKKASRVVELERELALAHSEVEAAIRNLEASNEDQKAINEEALSVNEEYQSTNEELLASKEELQSLNEELTALNSQLQETLERQRTSADDLQNVLYSTNVATVFLDAKFNIRFFTPATRSLFNVLPGDIGRPLTDLNSLAVDSELMPDATRVLAVGEAIEREVETHSGAWYMRRVLPYRAHSGEIEGVVITFVDVTERRANADALAAAKREAELASVAKSRFLAAASHDLRQPLQTLALLQGLLAKNVAGDKAGKLVLRMDESLNAMTGMLNTLLDINQIEIGAVLAEMVAFPVGQMLDRLRDEMSYHAQARELKVQVVSCCLWVRSDPRLLEQIVRNLVSNAMKYTQRGKVLIGCRRRGPGLRIEVWDTGIGIPAAELQAIFQEYHQVDNPARERARGLGLGLSIVKSLGALLASPVHVRSIMGRGSVFSIEVLTAPVPPISLEALAPNLLPVPQAVQSANGAILLVEDDPEVRELLTLFLTDEGYHVSVAGDGVAALALVKNLSPRPVLLLADYNLPNGVDGVELATKLRARLKTEIAAIILTGDISTRATRDIAGNNCVRLSKPVKLFELAQTIRKLLKRPRTAGISDLLTAREIAEAPPSGIVWVVDDDPPVRDSLRALLEEEGRAVETFASCEEFLTEFRPGPGSCLLIDAYLPGMSGLELLRKLRRDGQPMPAIMITGNSDVAMAVQAMQAGAADFIEKPVSSTELLASIERALEHSRDAEKAHAWKQNAIQHMASLTPRQRKILDMVLAGAPSKNIAADLGISQRTVENHRASIMKRSGATSLPALARLALAATDTARGEGT